MRAWAMRAQLVSSALALTEVPRALRRNAVRRPKVNLAPPLPMQVMDRLREVVLKPIDQEILLDAGILFEPTLRSLDAIHVVTAMACRPLDAFITYDKRQAAAARLVGLPVVSPGA